MGKYLVLLFVLGLVSAQEVDDFYPIPDTTTTDLPETIAYQNVLVVWQVVFFGTQVDQQFIDASETCYSSRTIGSLGVFVNGTGQPRETIENPNSTNYTLWYWAEVRDVDFNFFRDEVVVYTTSFELGRCTTGGDEIDVTLTESPSQLVVGIEAAVPFWAIYIIIGVLMVLFGAALAFLWWKEGKKPAYEITDYVEAVLPKES